MIPPEAQAAGPAAGARRAADPTPLCVDVDGTLIQTDLLWESLVLLLGRKPFYLPLVVVWLLRGRARLKREIAARVKLDVAALPYRQEFLGYLREQYEAGRQLYLASASDSLLVNRIAAHLGIFAGVVASEGKENLKAAGKRDALVARFGQQGYDYAGDSSADLAVWSRCRRAIVVNAAAKVVRGAAQASEVERVFEGRSAGARPWIRALRAHQWVKNLLVFLPVITSHAVLDVQRMGLAAAAFVAFSLCASSVYILNDLLDLRSDRLHATKRRRPFASGALGIPAGLLLLTVLLVLAGVVASQLPPRFAWILALYYATTLAYSTVLKKKLLIDVYVLGGLYTIRVFAGGAATGIMPSPWLLAFSLFLFLSLALVKRLSELRAMELESKSRMAGRGYIAGDVQAIGSLGTSSGFMCVLVLALYINSPQVLPLYRSPAVLWFLCPVLMYWLSRVWLLAFRGKMDADPVLFAMRDRVSYIAAFVVAAILAAASLGVPI